MVNHLFALALSLALQPGVENEEAVVAHLSPRHIELCVSAISGLAKADADSDLVRDLRALKATIKSRQWNEVRSINARLRTYPMVIVRPFLSDFVPVIVANYSRQFLDLGEDADQALMAIRESMEAFELPLATTVYVARYAATTTGQARAEMGVDALDLDNESLHAFAALEDRLSIFFDTENAIALLNALETIKSTRLPQNLFATDKTSESYLNYVSKNPTALEIRNPKSTATSIREDLTGADPAATRRARYFVTQYYFVLYDLSQYAENIVDREEAASLLDQIISKFLIPRLSGYSVVPGNYKHYTALASTQGVEFDLFADYQRLTDAANAEREDSFIQKQFLPWLRSFLNNNPTFLDPILFAGTNAGIKNVRRYYQTALENGAYSMARFFYDLHKTDLQRLAIEVVSEEFNEKSRGSNLQAIAYMLARFKPQLIGLKNIYGESIFDLAMSSSQFEIAYQLLKEKVHEFTKEEAPWIIRTALRRKRSAVASFDSSGQKQLIEWLILEFPGSLKDFKDGAGRSLVDIAAANEHFEIAAMLKASLPQQ